LRPLEHFGVVFGWGLRRLFKTKKFAWTAGLSVAVAALAGLAISGMKDPAYDLWDFLGTSVLGVCVPLIALALAAGGFGEEVSEQTLVFHLVRPISRTTLFIARFAAGIGPAIAAACALCLVATILSGVGLPLATVGLLLATAALGTVVVGAVYYALAALFRRGLVAGLVYTFVIEVFFQFIPGSVQKLALSHHVRSLFHRLCDADFAALSQRVAREAERGNNSVIKARRIQDIIAPEPWSTIPHALLVCGIVAVAALLIGARTIRRRDFALKD
jgi:ABC-type transport system involved in multi-copper enzyme maturation permease subunit